MKKILSAVLVFCMLFGIVVACDSGNGSGDGTDTKKEELTGDDEVGIPYSLRFDGETFKILTSPLSGDAYNEYYLDYEEDSGEVLSAAIERRNDKVRERFGIDLEIFHGNNYWSVASALVELNQADYYYYDAALASGAHVFPEALNNNFVDLNKLEYVDFDAPYWDKNCYEMLSVGGKNYIMVGDISMSVLQGAHCTFFNKQMLADANINDDIYQLVRDGSWTFDKMYEMAKKAYAENGDDKRNEEDKYGLFNMNIVTLLTSFGYNLTPKGEDDYPVIFNLTSEMETDFNYLREIIFDPSVTFICETMLSITDYGDFGHMWDWTRGHMFTNDQIMFMYCGFAVTDMLRDMKSDFGIIPDAKKDENQPAYHCTADLYTDYICVPTSVPLDKYGYIGAVLEYMASASTDTVRYAYVDEVLKQKRSRDTENEREMIDTIIGSIYYELSDYCQLDIRSILANSLEKGNLASQYAKYSLLYSDRIDVLRQNVESND